MPSSPPQTFAETGRWSFWSLLLYGTFGDDASVASRRADRRSRIAASLAAVLVVVITVAPGLELTLRGQAQAALVALLLSYVGWERWRYAAGLDELARSVYLDAFAITYLVGLVLFSLLGVMHAVAGWSVTPLVFVGLEPVRAAVLAWRSRRYA